MNDKIIEENVYYWVIEYNQNDIPIFQHLLGNVYEVNEPADYYNDGQLYFGVRHNTLEEWLRKYNSFYKTKEECYQAAKNSIVQELETETNLYIYEFKRLNEKLTLLEKVYEDNS